MAFKRKDKCANLFFLAVVDTTELFDLFTRFLQLAFEVVDFLRHVLGVFLHTENLRALVPK